MELVVQKCKAGGIECEKFMEHRHRNFCPYLVHNIVVGDTLSKITTPPLLCPLKKGAYTSNNILLTLSKFDLLPFDKFTWTVQLQFFERRQENNDEKIQIACWFIQLSRTTLSNKRRVKG